MENKHSQDFEALEAVDIKRIINLFRRSAFWIVFGLLIGMGVAYLVSKLQTPIYASTTQVMVARSNSQGPVTDITQELSGQQVAQTYVTMLSQDWVLETVSSRVGGEKIDKDQINVSAETNAQIINIRSEDADPVRANLIADTLVKVLAEQNESISSSRFHDAEANLDLQITDLESNIARLQGDLGKANAEALSQQLASAQTNINLTQDNILNAQAELDLLKKVGNTANAQSLLLSDQSTQDQNQLLLTKQMNDYQALKDKLSTDPNVQQDQTLAGTIQTQLDELNASIDETHKKIDSLAKEITLLTPLVESGAIDKALLAQQENIRSQQDLLVSYQDMYTKLLVAGKIDGTTDKITGLQNNLDLYQQIYLNALNNREALRLARMQNVTNIVQLNPAKASETPIRPRVLLNTLLGGVAGLILSITVILLLNTLDTTLKTHEDVRRMLGLPVLGYSLYMKTSKQDKSSPYVLQFPRSPAAEAYRSLRTDLDFIGSDQHLKSILISSSGSEEGKTTVAANLAVIMAQSGKRVVLLDADLRRPRLHRELGLVNRTGLSDLFGNKYTLKDTIQSLDNLGLSIVTSGGLPPNPAELLASKKMQEILEELESLFDFVVIDSPPTIVTDGQLIATHVSGVLLVLSPGSTQAEAARASIELYQRVGARVVGVVMNNVRARQGYYGGYAPYSEYGYYQNKPDNSATNHRNPGLFGNFMTAWQRKQNSPQINPGHIKEK